MNLYSEPSLCTRVKVQWLLRGHHKLTLTSLIHWRRTRPPDGRRLYTAPCRMGHAEFGSNDHLGDTRHFIFRLFRNFEIHEHFWKINNLETLERMCQSLAYHCSSNPFLVKYEVIKFRKKNLPLDGKSFFFINSSRLFTSYSDVKFWNHSVFTFCTCFNNVFYCKCCQNQLFLNLNRK